MINSQQDMSAKVEVKECQVGHEMGLLMSAINALESTTAELEKRLDNVLTTPDPPKENVKDDEPLVALASDIRSEKRRVSNYVNVLEDITARLQN